MSTFCQRVTVRIGVVFTVVVLSVAGSLLTRTAARASRQTDVNARDAHGMTPLDYAVEQNDIGSVLALIHAGADVMRGVIPAGQLCLGRLCTVTLRLLEPWPRQVPT